MKVKFIVYLLCLPLLGFSQNITDSLLLYYPMDGNANDLSGNNFHGTVNGATLVPDRFGNANSAYYFDGVNDYIDFPITSILKPTYPLTISFWAKLDILSIQKTKFINTDYVADDYFGVSMNVDNLGYLRIGFGGGNGFTNPGNRISFQATRAAINTGIWYHFTGIIHSDIDMDLYINCIDALALFESGTGNTSIAYTNFTPGTLGRSDGAQPPQYYQGAMDELKFWNRALTQAEISSLCEGTFNHSSWDCINNSCINLSNLSGAFSDSLTCVTSCIVPSWDCIANSCVDPGNGSGMYTTLPSCQSFCSLPSTWNCIANSCVDPGNGSGMYTVLSSCQAACGATSLDEFNADKKLLRIVDVLGRNTKKESNVPLFYFYDDGTVEKRINIY
jgi:hypothetical protein